MPRFFRFPFQTLSRKVKTSMYAHICVYFNQPITIKSFSIVTILHCDYRLKHLDFIVYERDLLRENNDAKKN